MTPTQCLTGHKVTALLDGDIVAYKAACVQERDGLNEHETAGCVLRIAESWCKYGQDTILCLSKGRSFRYDAYPDYKSNRKDKPKPPALKFCTEVLRDAFVVQEKDTWEADDVMGVLATSGHLEAPLIVTIDKDLRQVPGWHWNPDKEQWPTYVTPEQGALLEHLQWLTGDATDGYHGITKCEAFPRGMGPKTALKWLDSGDLAGYEQAVTEAYLQAAQEDAYKDAMRTCSKILQAK